MQSKRWKRTAKVARCVRDDRGAVQENGSISEKEVVSGAWRATGGGGDGCGCSGAVADAVSRRSVGERGIVAGVLSSVYRGALVKSAGRAGLEGGGVGLQGRLWRLLVAAWGPLGRQVVCRVMAEGNKGWARLLCGMAGLRARRVGGTRRALAKFSPGQG